MILCAAARGSHHVWWRYRLIDNKKCWYEGKALIDKSQLVWQKAIPTIKHYTDEDLGIPPLLPAPKIMIEEPEEPNWTPRIDQGFASLTPMRQILYAEPPPPPPPPPARWKISDIASITIMFLIISAACILFRVYRHLRDIS